MARKTFISYKYSEAQDLRDEIINSLGEDSKYYKGETIDSADLTDTSTDNIRENLKNMIYSTSVLIVIISPNMKESKWIDWEISYALKEIKREDKNSKINGVIGVIQKFNGNYDWIATTGTKKDGCNYVSYNTNKLSTIIKDNRYNSKPPLYHCEHCKTWCSDKGSYISFVEEEDFLKNPNNYIEKAYKKISEKDNYEIIKIK